MTDLAKLKALAQNATKGPWTVGVDSTNTRPMFMDAANGRAMLDFPKLRDDAIPQQRADADYFATITPDVLLALIERVEAAERDARRYRWLRDCRGGDVAVMNGRLIEGRELDEMSDAALAAGVSDE